MTIVQLTHIQYCQTHVTAITWLGLPHCYCSMAKLLQLLILESYKLRTHSPLPLKGLPYLLALDNSSCVYNIHYSPQKHVCKILVAYNTPLCKIIPHINLASKQRWVYLLVQYILQSQPLAVSRLLPSQQLLHIMQQKS